MILNAVDATSDGATEIKIHSPDTDVFVLALRRYPMLCVDASFVTGRGHNHREIKMGPIVQALGPTRTTALPAFHAFIGADNTGSFPGKGKLGCWKAFLEADEEVLAAMARLGTTKASKKYPLYSDYMKYLKKIIHYIPMT